MPYPDWIILTEDALDEVVEHVERHKAFAFDIESVGDHRGVPTQNEVTWLSIATYGMAVAIPMGHPIGDRIVGEDKIPKIGKDGKTRYYKHPVWEPPPKQLRRSVVFAKLRKLFFSDEITKIAHMLPVDVISTAKYMGGPAVPPYIDSRTLTWLADENQLTGLKPTVKRLYKVDYDKENVGKCVEKFPFKKVARYARLDAKFSWLLAQRLLPLIEAEELERAFALERELLEEVLIGTHMAGVPVDVPWLEQLRDELSVQVEKEEAAVYAAAGRIFNLDSPVQKSEVLFAPKRGGGQGLKPKKLTDGGQKKANRGDTLDYADYSTDAETLKAHAKNPVAAAIRAYQETSKLLSTYVHAYLGHDDKPCIIFDDRIYPTLDPNGTVTGRFASYRPNFQNIPTRTEAGKKIRRTITAPEGKMLVVADYGQIELVVLAHFAGKGALFDGFWDGQDPHTITASLIFQKVIEEITKAERQIGKTINFATVFGAGPNTIAEQAGISVAYAKEMLGRHAEEFPEVYRLKRKVIKVATERDLPHIRTLIGRKRRLPDLLSSDNADRSRAERQALNSLIQGSAADLIKIAMVRLARTLRERDLARDAKIILTVHDELVVECPEDVTDSAAAALREAMLGQGIQELIKVPLTSDVSIVKHWSEAK